MNEGLAQSTLAKLASSMRWVSGNRRAKIGFLVLIGLAVLGEQIVFAVHDASSARSSHRATHPPETVAGKIDLGLRQALGKSDRGVRRFKIVSITPHVLRHRHRDVTVQWSINNDLSLGTIGDGAQADAFLIFGHLFSLPLGILRVNLIGTYPLSVNGQPTRERPVMRLWLGRKTAQLIRREGGWGTVDAQSLWPLIHRTYVAPDFQPISSE